MKTFFVDCYTSNVEQSQKIDKFLLLLSKSGVCDFVKDIQKQKNKNDEIGGRPSFNPYNMLATVLYNFAFEKGTLRDIEDKCKNDLRCIYMLQGEQPTHSSFGNFINEYILPHQSKIFSLITKAIFEECKINMNNQHLDGTKYEANANKYKFVWKPTTFHKKLGDKIRVLLKEYELLRGIPNDDIIESKLVADKLTELSEKLKRYDLSLKENKKYKKDYELLSDYLKKSLEYEEKERICGPNRNSYYKTDIDSTAMCLKEDYYSGLGSNMHAAYNTQIMVANGLVTSYLVTQSRADIKDFIPLLNVYYSFYGFYPKSICADSGYGSLENYSYLDTHNIKNFVKYVSWQGNVSGSNPSQYRLNDDETITCLNGNVGYKDETNWHHRKADSIFYKVTGCNTCAFKLYCKRYMKNKDEDETPIGLVVINDTTKTKFNYSGTIKTYSELVDYDDDYEMLFKININYDDIYCENDIYYNKTINGYEVLYYANSYADDVTIIDSIDNIKVTSIGKYAFLWKHFGKLMIGDNVTKIRSNAFYECSGDVFIPSNVSIVNASAFNYHNEIIYVEASQKPEDWDTNWKTTSGSGTVIYSASKDEFINTIKSGDFVGVIKSDNTIELTKYNGSSKTVYIPRTINGRTVTSIATGFIKTSSYSSGINIYIPSTVTTIAGKAIDLYQYNYTAYIYLETDSIPSTYESNWYYNSYYNNNTSYITVKTGTKFDY